MFIDTGAAKNYIKPVKELKNVMPVASPFSVSSIHGSTEIKQKCFMKVFKHTSPFFLLNSLNSIDAIIGLPFKAYREILEPLCVLLFYYFCPFGSAG